MAREQSENPDKHNSHKSKVDKVLSQPGIRQTIDLVQQYALENAIDQTIEQGFEGEFGDEPKAILESDERNAIELFSSYKGISSYISDSYLEILECLASEAGDRIADLWNLSESAADIITKAIYPGEDAEVSRKMEFCAPVILLFNRSDLENNQNFAKRHRELEEWGITVYCSDEIPKGRIYLDVTELTTQQLRSVYKDIKVCRDILNIKHEDLRTGAPKSFDVNRALKIHLLKRMGKTNIVAAKETGFNIDKNCYDDDIPPRVFYKYKNLGEVISKRLESLEKYLDSYIEEM